MTAPWVRGAQGDDMTPQQADDRSLLRATGMRRRLWTVAGFTVACFALLASILQHQQAELRELLDAGQEYVVTSCAQRQSNVLRTNATWERLADLEERSTVGPELERLARAAAYRAAQLDVPDCRGAGLAIPTPSPGGGPR